MQSDSSNYYINKQSNKKITFIILLLLVISNSGILKAQGVQYITSANGEYKFTAKQVKITNSSSKEDSAIALIRFDANKRFQKMEGFGYALTGGSAALIDQLSAPKKNAILQEVFGNSKANLGVSYIRISMGASDLDANVFSYCDLPTEETDSLLKHFNLSEDTLHLIPILKKALAIRPALKIMASPWSPPIWMKSNGLSMGGHLLKKYYASYANYFVMYIQAMKKQGIKIAAVTMQNEPEHGGNNPSLLMDALEQKEFLKNYLGPQFKKANIKTEIVLFDHNADHPNYPISIMNDSLAKSYAAASAFHLYLGDESALSKVHFAHPDKKIYFTEQWTGAKGEFGGDLMWHLEHIVLGTINNWSSVVLEWNLAANAKFEPHTLGGCTECKGAFTIQGDSVSRNASYYIIGQASKYIPAGAQRVAATSSVTSIKTAGFILPNGKKVSLVLNTGAAKKVKLIVENREMVFDLPSASASTLVW